MFWMIQSRKFKEKEVETGKEMPGGKDKGKIYNVVCFPCMGVNTIGHITIIHN